MLQWGDDWGWYFAGAALASPGRDAEFVLRWPQRRRVAVCLGTDQSQVTKEARDDCLAPEEHIPHGDLGPG